MELAIPAPKRQKMNHNKYRHSPYLPMRKMRKREGRNTLGWMVIEIQQCDDGLFEDSGHVREKIKSFVYNCYIVSMMRRAN